MSKRFPLWRLRDGEDQEAADLLLSRLLAFSALGAGLCMVMLIGGVVGISLTDSGGLNHSRSVFLVVVGLVGLPIGAEGVNRWSSRRFALARAGWRPGTAETTESSRRTRASADVRFDSGDWAAYDFLWMIGNRNLASELENRSELDVWVGGEGNAQVMYFEKDRSLFAVKPI